MERIASATVVARRAVDADALAKACCVLEPEQALRLIHSLPDTECLIVMASGQLNKSSGWPLLESPQPVALGTADDPPAKGKPAGASAQREGVEEGRQGTATAGSVGQGARAADQFRDQQPDGQ